MRSYRKIIESLKKIVEGHYEVFNECKEGKCKAQLPDDFAGFVISDKSRLKDGATKRKTIKDIQSEDSRKFCDCVIFDADEKALFLIFVEIKAVKRIRRYEKEAIEQITHAAIFVKDKILPYLEEINGTGSDKIVFKYFCFLVSRNEAAVKSIASIRHGSRGWPEVKIMGRQILLKFALCGHKLGYRKVPIRTP